LPINGFYCDLKQTFFYAFLWVVLTENYRITNIIIGVFLSILILLFTSRIFDKKNYTRIYNITLWRLVLYVLYLICLIFRSGFETIFHILKNEGNTCVTEYHAGLTDAFSLCLLANAITLTPGTVSLNLQDNVLTILSFADKNDQSVINIRTLHSLERILGRRPL
jgi:multicomponent Na+:H+ antiporter subunit E